MFKRLDRVACSDCVYCSSKPPHVCRKHTPKSNGTDDNWAVWPEVNLDRDWCGEGVSTKTRYDHSYFNRTEVIK